MNSLTWGNFRFYHAIHLNKTSCLKSWHFSLQAVLRCKSSPLCVLALSSYLFLKKSLPCYKMERRKKQNTKGRQIESLPIDTLSQFPSNVRATAASLDVCGALPSQQYPARWKLVLCVGKRLEMATWGLTLPAIPCPVEACSVCWEKARDGHVGPYPPSSTLPGGSLFCVLGKG